MSIHLHELKDQPVNLGDFVSARTEQDIKVMMSHAPSAQCFDAGHVSDFANAKYIGELIKLPYPVTWVEFMVNDATEKNNTCVYGSLAVNYKDRAFALFLMRSSLGWQYISLAEVCDGIIRPWGIYENAEKQVNAVVKIWGCFLSALNCANVEKKLNNAPARLNKKRIKNGKQPLYSYWTLHVDLSGNKNIRKNGVGSHASPRVHLRRGHMRRLRNGKYCWVQACVVGKSRGVVMKDYAVSF